MASGAGKIGRALACGTTVVVKPAPVDPLGVAELCRIVDSVLPPGVLNFVCGSAPEIGAAPCESPDVQMVSFPGSTAGGRQSPAGAARRLRRTRRELGGKPANLLLPHAPQPKGPA